MASGRMASVEEWKNGIGFVGLVMECGVRSATRRQMWNVLLLPRCYFKCSVMVTRFYEYNTNLLTPPNQNPPGFQQLCYLELYFGLYDARAAGCRALENLLGCSWAWTRCIVEDRRFGPWDLDLVLDAESWRKMGVGYYMVLWLTGY